MDKKRENVFITAIMNFFGAISYLVELFFTWIINQNWLRIFAAILICSLIFFPVAWGVSKFLSDQEGPWYDDQKLSLTSGDIDAEGHVLHDVKNAVYTKDMILCDGLRITLSFGVNYYYEIHYFTADDRWISGVLQYNSGVYTVEPDEMPADAAGIRLVILTLDKSDIGFFERFTAANALSLDIYREGDELDDQPELVRCKTILLAGARDQSCSCR